jgi:excisionase family DNA binding protein
MPQRLTYTVTEAAEILGISKTSAYECVQRGEIPSLTFGRRIVIAKRDLEDLVGPLAETRDPAPVS